MLTTDKFWIVDCSSADIFSELTLPMVFSPNDCTIQELLPPPYPKGDWFLELLKVVHCLVRVIYFNVSVECSVTIIDDVSADSVCMQ